MILTLAQTVQRAQSGDKAAFGELYSHYYKEMYRYALYSLGHEQDAQDIVAETVASAYAQITHLRDADAFPMWLFRILSNQIKRKKKSYIAQKKHVSLEEAEEVASDELLSESKLDLNKALDMIAKKDRDIVILSVVDGFTCYEIAEILKMNPATVRSRLSRSLKRLQQILSVTSDDQKCKQKGEKHGKEANQA